ncbi:MAG: hypothetical protein FWH03_02715 [Firmicutes bacterium]|nr:hypothetical protein [Bacillota bacterium]
MADKFYNELKNNAWVVKDDAAKLAVLTEIEKNAAKLCGRATRGIAVESCPGILGYYHAGKNKLIISKTALESAGSAICAVLHEGRHAYQHDVISKKQANKNRLAWTKNWNGYLNPNAPGISQIDYFLQPLEKDAWEYSIKNLKKISAKVKDPYIKNDLTDIQLTAAAQSIKAHRLYGRNAAQIIQTKIDLAFSQKSGGQNSYPHVVEQLSKEGLHADRAMPDYITPVAQVEKAAAAKAKEATAAEKEKAAKRAAIAQKYGFGEKAAADASKRATQANKGQSDKTAAPDKAAKPSKSVTTVKVSIKSNKGDQK